jgi:hypothetical protein
MTWPSVAGAESGDREVSSGWLAVGVVGLALFVAGVTDLLLAWLPPRFGSPEWEFGTISATLNNMPVPTMGLALALAFAAASDRKSSLAAAGIWSILVVLFLVVAGVFYALDVPLALRAVQDPVAHRGLRAAIVKGVVGFISYGGFHLWAAVFAWRRIRAG